MHCADQQEGGHGGQARASQARWLQLQRKGVPGSDRRRGGRARLPERFRRFRRPGANATDVVIPSLMIPNVNGEALRAAANAPGGTTITIDCYAGGYVVSTLVLLSDLAAAGGRGGVHRRARLQRSVALRNVFAHGIELRRRSCVPAARRGSQRPLPHRRPYRAGYASGHALERRAALPARGLWRRARSKRADRLHSLCPEDLQRRRARRKSGE